MCACLIGVLAAQEASACHVCVGLTSRTAVRLTLRPCLPRCLSAGCAGLQDRGAVAQPHFNTQVWDAGPRRYVCEPLFVPKPQPRAEDDGWILAILHNAETHKGELVILDAQAIADGPLATIRLPHHLAAGLHGSFSPQLLLNGWAEAAARDWREANVVQQV